MDKQILTLKKIVSESIHMHKKQISKNWGKPKRKSVNEIWFFNIFNFSPFRDEIAFIFEEDIVVDVCLTRCFLWIEVKCVFYLEGQNPDFKVITFF